jgi:nucleotide-binding universal stress UspA family protein
VSYTVFLSLMMATFACIGFVLAIVMGRLGFSPFAWGLLGLLLGPIALLLALVEVRNERPWWSRLVASGDPGSGPVDVLVGIDGSPESAAATTAALKLLGDRVGRLTLVAVTDVDDSVAGREERARLRGELERQAEAVRAWLQERDASVQAKQTVVPELQLMSGPPAHSRLDRRRGRLRLAGGRGQRGGDVQRSAWQCGDQAGRPGERASAGDRRPGQEGPWRARAALGRSG